MVDRATWQPDCAQKDVIVHCKSKKIVDRYVVNGSFCTKTVYTECQASRKEWSEWYSSSNSYKPVVSGISFADVVRANLGQ